MNLPKVLFVDDEANILQSVRRVMRKADIEIDTVTSPTDALALVAKEKFAVVISDQRMPGIGGVELLERVGPSRPTPSASF
jgi:DNA-binding NtrC family response regulator